MPKVMVEDIQDCLNDDMYTIAEHIKDNEHLSAVPLKVGLKIECKEDILNNIKNESYIQKTFKLNIKRLNRWWYSVYFDNP